LYLNYKCCVASLLQEYAVQNLLLYYDSDTQWPAVYKTSKVGVCGITDLVISGWLVV
jgi:hypothetical protein